MLYGINVKVWFEGGCESLFGPFEGLAEAELCVRVLAGRRDVRSAVVLDKRYSRWGPVRCLGVRCEGTLEEWALGRLRCGLCCREYRIEDEHKERVDAISQETSSD